MSYFDSKGRKPEGGVMSEPTQIDFLEGKIDDLEKKNKQLIEALRESITERAVYRQIGTSTHSAQMIRHGELIGSCLDSAKGASPKGE